MQKIILIVVGIVVIGGGAWFFTGNNDGSTEEANIATTHEREVIEDKAEENLSGFGSLGNIFGLGDNKRCEFESTYEGQTTEGVIYTDGKRARVDTVTEVAETGTVTGSVINDGNFAYVWGESPEGSLAIKMVNPEDETDSGFDSVPDIDSYVDLGQEVKYDCKRWGIDESVFVPPGDIEFMNMEDMMGGAMQGLPEGFELPEGIPAY